MKKEKPVRVEKPAVQMKFSEDKYYRGEILYVKDVVHKVPGHLVEKWLKRGGVIVSEIEKPAPAPKPIEAPKAPEVPKDKSPVAESDSDLLGNETKKDEDKKVSPPASAPLNKPANKQVIINKQGRR